MFSDTVKPLPWLSYRNVVDDQIAAGMAREAERQRKDAQTQPYDWRTASTNPAQRRRDEAAERVARQAALPAKSASKTQVNGASPAQAKLIDDLLTEKIHPYTSEEVVAAKKDWRKTKEMINFLLAAPRRRSGQPEATPTAEVKKPSTPDFSGIGDGYYAVTGVDGNTKFYRISTNKKTGWRKVQVQASDTLYLVSSRIAVDAILHQIREDGVEKSQMRYALELGQCYVCGRTLTDSASRDLGIGPICLEKRG